MMQQILSSAIPDVGSTFREVFLYNVLYHLKNDSVEDVRKFLRDCRGWYSDIDGWPALQREVDQLILDYSQTHGVATTVPFERSLENNVLKKNHHGQAIDFVALHRLLEQHFVANIAHQYEWVAPWRILYDMTLLEDPRLTSFAKQMNLWYPHVPKPCCDDAMNNYTNPYLGNTPHNKWTIEGFRKNQNKKQSVNGFWRLKNLCDMLEKELDIRLILRK